MRKLAHTIGVLLATTVVLGLGFVVFGTFALYFFGGGVLIEWSQRDLVIVGAVALALAFVGMLNEPSMTE